MHIDKLRVTCLKCSTVFDGEIVVDAPIDVAVASMKAMRCPSCGSCKCGLGGNYTDAPPVSAPLLDRAKWWSERGEHGVSSETIYAAFAGGSPRSEGVPHDPDDFRRCRLLFDLLPEWRQNIARLGEVYHWFEPFVQRWDEFDRLWDEESPNGTCPKLYELMKIAECESLAIKAQGMEG